MRRSIQARLAVAPGLTRCVTRTFPSWLGWQKRDVLYGEVKLPRIGVRWQLVDNHPPDWNRVASRPRSGCHLNGGQIQRQDGGLVTRRAFPRDDHLPRIAIEVEDGPALTLAQLGRVSIALLRRRGAGSNNRVPAKNGHANGATFRGDELKHSNEVGWGGRRINWGVGGRGRIRRQARRWGFAGTAREDDEENQRRREPGGPQPDVPPLHEAAKGRWSRTRCVRVPTAPLETFDGAVFERRRTNRRSCSRSRSARRSTSSTCSS
jgi:hypothetical protein